MQVCGALSFSLSLSLSLYIYIYIYIYIYRASLSRPHRLPPSPPALPGFSRWGIPVSFYSAAKGSVISQRIVMEKPNSNSGSTISASAPFEPRTKPVGVGVGAGPTGVVLTEIAQCVGAVTQVSRGLSRGRREVPLFAEGNSHSRAGWGYR